MSVMRLARRAALVGLTGVTAALLPGAAAAQDNSLSKDVTYAIPKSPAFNLIGVSPTEVTRPGTARELATALLSAVDTAGHLVQGFALNLSPALLTIPTLDLNEYQRSTWKRILYNTTVSAGTAKAAADSTATQLAIGVQSVLIDRTDPMADSTYTDTLAAEMLASCINLEPLAKAIECTRETKERFRKEYLDRKWNALTVAVGVAGGWQFAESKLDEFEAFGAALWLTAGLPVTRYGQLLLQAQYQARADSVPDEYDGFTYGTKLLVGSAKLNGFAELVGRELRDTPSTVDASTNEWSVGIEFKAATDTWVSTGLGARFADAMKDDRVFLVAGIRWSVSNGPNFR
jgi:hypothetical protein